MNELILVAGVIVVVALFNLSSSPMISAVLSSIALVLLVIASFNKK